MIAKLEDWRERLDAHVARSARLPFVWGVHDCGLHAADAVLAQTGVDFAAVYRGHYSTYQEALALLNADGYEDHAALAASVLSEIPVARAQIGDLAAVEFPEGTTLMLVAGHRLIGPMPTMAGNVALTRASRAFAVGRAA